MSAPIVKAEMLIPKPAAEVFDAFADPAITTRFWFTKSSGKLEAGKRVRWDWEMYGVNDEIEVGPHSSRRASRKALIRAVTRPRLSLEKAGSRW